eukprot:6197884-Pleurochrysis_carterae.AAC.3
MTSDVGLVPQRARTVSVRVPADDLGACAQPPQRSPQDRPTQFTGNTRQSSLVQWRKVSPEDPMRFRNLSGRMLPNNLASSALNQSLVNFASYIYEIRKCRSKHIMCLTRLSS